MPSCIQTATIYKRHCEYFVAQHKLSEAIPGPDPWPRPGMQGLSSMDYTPEVLQLLYSAPAKWRQGRLIYHA